MARASAMLGGNYIKKEDLKETGPERLVIAGIDIAEFDNEKKRGKVERKWELLFTDDRKLTLNNGNTQVLIAAYGDETDLWLGQAIVAYHDPSVMFGGKRIGGVKIKVPSTASTKTLPAAEAAPDPFA